MHSDVSDASCLGNCLCIPRKAAAEGHSATDLLLEPGFRLTGQKMAGTCGWDGMRAEDVSMMAGKRLAGMSRLTRPGATLANRMIYPGSVSYTDPTSLHQLLLSSPNAAQSETNEDDMRLANGVLGRHTSVDIQRAGFPASPVLGSGSAFGYSTGAIATGNMTSGAMQNCANEGCGQPVAGETRLNRPFGVSFGSYTGTFPRRHVSTGRLSSVGLAQPCLSGGQASYLRASSIRLSTAGVSGDVMIMNGGLRTHSQNHNGPSLSSMLPGSGGQGSFEAGDCPRSPYQQSQQPFKQHNLKTSSFTSQPRQYHQMQNQGVNQQQEELTDVLASNAALQNGSNFLVYADKSQLSLAKQGRPILLQLPNSLSSTQQTVIYDDVACGLSNQYAPITLEQGCHPAAYQVHNAYLAGMPPSTPHQGNRPQITLASSLNNGAATPGPNGSLPLLFTSLPGSGTMEPGAQRPSELYVALQAAQQPQTSQMTGAAGSTSRLAESFSSVISPVESTETANGLTFVQPACTAGCTFPIFPALSSSVFAASSMVASSISSPPNQMAPPTGPAPPPPPPSATPVQSIATSNCCTYARPCRPTDLTSVETLAPMETFIVYRGPLARPEATESPEVETHVWQKVENAGNISEPCVFIEQTGSQVNGMLEHSPFSQSNNLISVTTDVEKNRPSSRDSVSPPQHIMHGIPQNSM